MSHDAQSVGSVGDASLKGTIVGMSTKSCEGEGARVAKLFDVDRLAGCRRSVPG
jgi:hypothetical protein